MSNAITQTPTGVRLRPRRSFLGSVTGLVERLVTRQAQVEQVQEIAPDFQLFVLKGDDLKNAGWQPGHKIDLQIGDLSYRAYTPVEWDPEDGRIELLVYLHGQGPGSEFVKRLRPGSGTRVYGPRTSTDLSVCASTAFFGDETSVALMAAYRSQNADFRGQDCFIETDHAEATRAALMCLGLTEAIIMPRTTGCDHLSRVSDFYGELQQRAPRTRFVLTGRAASVQQLRRSLLGKAIPKNSIETHAFWSEGKVALG